MLNQLDPNNHISYRLYREHTKLTDGAYIKDLSLLGRDLSKTLIVDNVKENFKNQESNGIHIANFEGADDDVELHILGIELRRIAMFKLDLLSEIKKLQGIMRMRRNEVLPLH